MKITRNNYEAFFVDYLDGNLEDAVVDDFLEFLRKHPDLKEELQQAEAVKFPPGSALFRKKEDLYKEKYDQEEPFNQAAVAYLENDLEAKEKEEFEAYLAAHPARKKDYSLFEKTRLQARTSVVFHNKARLYHSHRGKTVLLWFTRVAAVVAVAFLVYRFGSTVVLHELMPDGQVTISENRQEQPAVIQLPENVVKKEATAPAGKKTVLPEKKAATKIQPQKSLRESNQGRIDHEKVAEARIPVEVPDKIPALYASLRPEPLTNAGLVPVEPKTVTLPSFDDNGRLLGDLVREKAGLDNLSLHQLARLGLNLVSSISKDKFNYQTNPRGQVTSLQYDSRLLAFSIPTNSQK